MKLIQLVIVFLWFPVFINAQLLSDTQLSQERIYTSIEVAMQNPERVYMLHLKYVEETINPNDLLVFKNLQGLDISTKIDLDTFPGVLKDLQNLQWVTVANNSFKVVSSDFLELPHLKALSLYSNEIAYLPEIEEKNTTLTSLSLHSNKIERIPASISNLSALEHISIYNNRLKDVPQEIGDLEYLESLNMAYNQIEHFPTEIGKLHNTLQFCKVYNNNCSIDHYLWLKKMLPGTKVYIHQEDGCVMSYNDLELYHAGDTVKMKRFLDDKIKLYFGEE